MKKATRIWSSRAASVAFVIGVFPVIAPYSGHFMDAPWYVVLYTTIVGLGAGPILIGPWLTISDDWKD